MTRENTDPALPFGDFLDRLRRQGFTIGVEHHLRLRTLVARAGGDLKPEDLKTALCPLFATNAEQQEQFYRTFDACFAALRVSEAAGGTPAAAATTPRESKDRVRRWPYLAGATAAAVAAVALLTWKTNDLRRPTSAPPRAAAPSSAAGPAPSAGPAGTPARAARPAPVSRARSIAVDVRYPPGDAPQWLLLFADHRVAAGWAAVAGPIFFWLLYEVYRRRSQKLILRKNRGKIPPYTWPIHTESAQASVYDPQELASVSRRLHRRYLGETERLDVAATVTASIAALGFPTFRYRKDSRLPEYLFLIDRAGFRDHRARLFEHLAAALREQGLYVSAYFFEGDPRVCWDSVDDEAVHLEQLQRRFAGYRLLLFSEGEQMLDAVSGSPAAWVKQLESWPERALLTPRPREEWGLAELTLASQLLVAPATLDGLETLAYYFELPPASSAGAASGGGWDRADGELITLLREFLGADVFQWLCACAVYPELHWDLTLRLGTLRGMAAGLVSEQNLVKLVRLPWFRSGSIPDDVRRELIGQLDDGVEREVRASIVELLEKNPAPAGTFAADTLKFQIAYQKVWSDPRDRAARKQLQKSLESIGPEELVQDFAYLEAAESAARGPLAILLPRRLLKLLFPGGAPWLGPRVGVRAALAVLAMSVMLWGLLRSDREVDVEMERYRRALAAGLDFGVAAEGGTASVRWSPEAPGVRNAVSGVLRIQEDGAAQGYALELTPELLRAGTAGFQARGERVKVALRVRDARGNWVEESAVLSVPKGLALVVLGEGAASDLKKRRATQPVVEVRDESVSPIQIGGKVFQAPKASAAQIAEAAPIEGPGAALGGGPAASGVEKILKGVGVLPDAEPPTAKAVAAQAGTEPALGMVVMAATAQLRRKGNESWLSARAGDLLFEGDELRPGGSATSWLFCPAMTLESTAGALVQFGNSGTQARQGQIARTPVKVCELPRLRRMAAASQQQYGVSMTRGGAPAPAAEPVPANVRNELAAANAALAANANDLAALVATGAIFEKYGLAVNAWEQYQKVLRVAPEAVWAKAKVFELGERIALLSAPARAPTGRTYALVIGISKYQKVPSLDFAAADARLFSEFLRSPRGGGLPADQVLLLTDENATAAAIRNGLQSFAKGRSGKGDTVIFYLGGNSATEGSKARQSFVLAYDSDPQDLQTTALPMAELGRFFEELGKTAGRVLGFLDVSRSGGLPQSASLFSAVEPQSGEVLVLTSSRPREVALEGPQFGGGHGAFTYYLLKGLNGEADADKDGAVSANELIAYVQREVPAATGDRQHPRDLGNVDFNGILSDVRKVGISIK